MMGRLKFVDGRIISDDEPKEPKTKPTKKPAARKRSRNASGRFKKA